MSSGIRLIVGLGNPGIDYQATRHNAGAWFVAQLAEAKQITLRHDNKFQGLRGIAKWGDTECHLFLPATFMNLSGQPVAALMKYYKLSPDALLIAHDEIDLPVGEIRLKFDGGHGGHNGLRDVIRHLNTHQFYRLRIGVGHPGSSKDVVDYVLKPPSKADRLLIDASLENADQIIPSVIKGEFQQAMKALHTKGK